MSSIETKGNCSYIIPRTKAGMDELEPISQSFIIKVWVEEHSDAGGSGTWRGHITDVLSGERRYVKNLDEIGDFILETRKEIQMPGFNDADLVRVYTSLAA